MSRIRKNIRAHPCYPWSITKNSLIASNSSRSKSRETSRLLPVCAKFSIILLAFGWAAGERLQGAIGA